MLSDCLANNKLSVNCFLPFTDSKMSLTVSLNSVLASLSERVRVRVTCNNDDVRLFCTLAAGVRPPLTTRLQMTDVYDQKTNKPRPDVLKNQFIGEGRLKPDVAMRIITDGAAVFKQEKCLLEIPQPITGLSSHICIFCLRPIWHKT